MQSAVGLGCTSGSVLLEEILQQHQFKCTGANRKFCSSYYCITCLLNILKQYAFAETIICGLKCNFPLSLCQSLLTMLIAQLLMTWRPNENECLTVLIHRVREKLSVKSASPHSVPRCSTIFPSCGYKSTFYHISPWHPLLYFPLWDGNMVDTMYTQYCGHQTVTHRTQANFDPLCS